MKTITCLDCEQQFSGETAGSVMEQMMEHYMEVHHDILDPDSEEPREGWFVEFNQRWDTSPAE